MSYPYFESYTFADSMRNRNFGLHVKFMCTRNFSLDAPLAMNFMYPAHVTIGQHVKILYVCKYSKQRHNLFLYNAIQYEQGICIGCTINLTLCAFRNAVNLGICIMSYVLVYRYVHRSCPSETYTLMNWITPSLLCVFGTEPESEQRIVNNSQYDNVW